MRFAYINPKRSYCILTFNLLHNRGVCVNICSVQLVDDSFSCLVDEAGLYLVIRQTNSRNSHGLYHRYTIFAAKFE